MLVSDVAVVLEEMWTLQECCGLLETHCCFCVGVGAGQQKKHIKKHGKVQFLKIRLLNQEIKYVNSAIFGFPHVDVVVVVVVVAVAGAVVAAAVSACL